MDAIVETQNLLKAAIFKKKAKKVRLQDLVDLLSHNNVCSIMCASYSRSSFKQMLEMLVIAHSSKYNKLVVPRKNHSVQVLSTVVCVRAYAHVHVCVCVHACVWL